MINKKIAQEARVRIGEHLKTIRKQKGISTYKLTKDYGLKFDLIKSIESGSANYTIDNFLAYISALDCYFYLANRDGKHLDLDDLSSKA